MSGLDLKYRFRVHRVSWMRPYFLFRKDHDGTMDLIIGNIMFLFNRGEALEIEKEKARMFGK